MDCFDWINDLNLFCRKLLLFKHYSRTTNPDDDIPLEVQWNTQETAAIQDLDSFFEHQGIVQTDEVKILSSLKPKSIFCHPWQTCPQVDVFARLVADKFKKLPIFAGEHNLTKSEQKALAELCQMTDVEIKRSDKGDCPPLLRCYIWCNPRIRYNALPFEKPVSTLG
ncbi:hypothetical protein FKM82_018497 [Ascaphus truei]